ncbi:MAG: hypothetical protein HY287_02485 [Planctomycetes bacterium]|nr:hypothetical protein [Planctomycetota bacterium]MBI3833177.1 hypothetical protein [Planctomycetota bacterium]
MMKESRLQIEKSLPLSQSPEPGKNEQLDEDSFPNYYKGLGTANDPRVLFDIGEVLITWNTAYHFDLKDLSRYLVQHLYGNENSKYDKRAIQRAVLSGGHFASRHSNSAGEICYVVTTGGSGRNTSIYWGPEWDYDGPL